MDKQRKRISEKILYIRNLQGITREKFAEDTNLSISYLYQLETGKTSIGLGALIRIAKVLRVTLDELVAIDTKLPYDREIEMLFVGLVQECSEDELHIIIKIARSLKEVLRENERK